MGKINCFSNPPEENNSMKFINPDKKFQIYIISNIPNRLKAMKATETETDYKDP